MLFLAIIFDILFKRLVVKVTDKNGKKKIKHNVLAYYEQADEEEGWF